MKHCEFTPVPVGRLTYNRHLAAYAGGIEQQLLAVLPPLTPQRLVILSRDVFHSAMDISTAKRLLADVSPEMKPALALTVDVLTRNPTIHGIPSRRGSVIKVIDYVRQQFIGDLENIDGGDLVKDDPSPQFMRWNILDVFSDSSKFASNFEFWIRKLDEVFPPICPSSPVQMKDGLLFDWFVLDTDRHWPTVESAKTGYEFFQKANDLMDKIKDRGLAASTQTRLLSQFNERDRFTLLYIDAVIATRNTGGASIYKVTRAFGESGHYWGLWSLPLGDLSSEAIVRILFETGILRHNGVPSETNLIFDAWVNTIVDHLYSRVDDKKMEPRFFQASEFPFYYSKQSSHLIK